MGLFGLDGVLSRSVSGLQYSSAWSAGGVSDALRKHGRALCATTFDLSRVMDAPELFDHLDERQKFETIVGFEWSRSPW
ncbi:hypothetical protein [Nocardia australiensis]|uniref:hypothetical protein n=1 Tax=Nocardia australiensis TaxID=2887191 RepID=UPI001D1499AE|nr:hypothetical protein [Nocardia australiensis]